MSRTTTVFFLLMGVTLLVGFFTVDLSAAAEKENGAATMVINGGRYGDVPFPHKTHQETLADCNLCHRLFPKKSGSIVTLKASNQLEKRQVMNQCRTCHSDRKKNGEKAGPTSCSGCHTR